MYVTAITPCVLPDLSRGQSLQGSQNQPPKVTNGGYVNSLVRRVGAIDRWAKAYLPHQYNENKRTKMATGGGGGDMVVTADTRPTQNAL